MRPRSGRLGALAVAILLAGPVLPVRAQASASGARNSDSLLERLLGTWRMTGHVRRTPVTYDLSVRRVLADRFVELHMIDSAAPPRYEARIFIGEDTVPGRVIVHWLDSFGAAYSVPPGFGGVSGDTLRFEFAYPAGPFRDTFVFRRTDGAWDLHVEAGSDGGEWRTFARYTVLPLSPPIR